MKARRTILQLVTVIALCASVAMPYSASAAYVTSADISGNTIKNQWVPYTTSRYTNASPYRISMMKTDGPSMFARIRGCNGYEWAGYGPTVEFPNDDPTPEFRLRDTSTYALRFCLNSYATGNNTYDTFSGVLSWWVQ